MTAKAIRQRSKWSVSSSKKKPLTGLSFDLHDTFDIVVKNNIFITISPNIITVKYYLKYYSL